VGLACQELVSFDTMASLRVIFSSRSDCGEHARGRGRTEGSLALAESSAALA
jgi:hypothetical protein